jgi:hypothetical protein
MIDGIKILPINTLSDSLPTWTRRRKKGETTVVTSIRLKEKRIKGIRLRRTVKSEGDVIF